MTHLPRSSHRPEPLPEDFDQVLRTLDADLGDELRRQLATTPAGLVDRVFQASAPSLADRALVVLGRIRRADRWWGRLAAAAALGLVAVLAATLLNRPASDPAGPNAHTRTVALELDWLEHDPADSMAEEVGYLLDTGGLGSMDQIAGELESAFGAGLP